jgi:MoaA/NifB/PqqE/SkfB family radical SAM enzyme
VNFRCNQACHFCFVSTHLPTASEASVEAAIVEIAEAGGVVVLSGGEPTLNPRILDYVTLARTHGASEVELQTNAIRLGQAAGQAALEDAPLAQSLADRGVDQAFISLHGSRAAISDAVTDAPGTFDKTVLGIDAWVKTGKSTRINFVFCRENATDFVSYVELVADRWPSAVIIVSFVAPSTDMVPRTTQLIPRYAEVLPELARGIARATELGVAVGGFESMCGIPLCLVPSELAAHAELAAIPDGFDGGEFVKAEACEQCALSERCFGVRRGYAELYGTEEFRPVAR